jgi:ubiquitin C-terminal hydrolase
VKLCRDYFTATVIEGDFECEVCKCKYNKREKTQRIVAMPTVLIVVLSRFTYDLGRSARRKVCDRVRIDNWLLFGNITEPQKPDNYRLTSFINHLGKNAESGHYQSYVRYPKHENRWLNFDDDFVTEAYQGRVIDLVRGLSQFDTPYVLFYERRQ